MKIKALLATIITFAFISICFAAITGFSGKWTGGLKMPNQTEFPVTYTFKLNGIMVTGTASTPEGDIHIKNGTATGNDFTFIVPVNSNDIQNTCKYYPQGDSISVNIDYLGYKLHTTLTRDNK